jgi:TetR/AcrR family transcriptional regulator, repressor for neighboring sulfatase
MAPPTSQAATVRPKGRAEVVSALLDAARTLIAERGPDVALRDIAERANVNFGLIYQYVGTKEQLVREVNRRAALDAAERLRAAAHLDEALAMLMTFGDGTTARLVAWAALGGTQSQDLFRDSPALDVLARLMVNDAAESGRDVSLEDARVLAALAMAVALGWRLFGSTALTAAGLDGTHPERYDERIRAHFAQLGTAVTAPVTPLRPRGTARSSR